ncbi:hypothetical protein [Mycolicibacterium sp.]|uniref:hypothetical protein n=1 Tax=Mycolicibacterium sp. TaxID=2320850 RepID=UPI003D129C81
MSFTRRPWPALATAALVGACALVAPPAAVAQPDPGAQTETAPPPEPELLHNVTYRARVDGVSRGATISYRADGDQVQTANPTMVPGRVFEAMTVLPESGIANVRVSIQWPYSANLHCEILIDDALVAQADDFIAPRVLPQRDDPDYGALTCEAPVSGIANTVPVDPAVPPPDALPPDQPVGPIDVPLPPA